MTKTKLRPLGDVMLDMEPLIEEMMVGHDLQHGEVMDLVYGYLQRHYPSSREEYEDGDEIEYYYGPKRK